MLGESILSLLIVEVTGQKECYVTFYCGILSVVLLQYMHFRSQPHDPDHHAMRRTKEAGFLFSRLIYIRRLPSLFWAVPTRCCCTDSSTNRRAREECF